MWKRSVVFVSLLLAGCAGQTAAPLSRPADSQPSTQPTTASSEPRGRQLARATELLHGKRYSGLLHFESARDGLFVMTSPASDVAQAAAHTGRAGLLLRPGTQVLRLKLSSMLAGRAFPGDWTLVGFYLRAGDAAGATLTCADESGKAMATRRLALRPGEWTAAMLDISALPAPPRGDVTLEVRFDQPAAGPVHADDVVLIDNRQTLVDDGPEGWTVTRAGLRVTCERKLRFTFGVVTSDGSPQGWTVEEANALRARFASAGETKALTVYADGRSLWDGAFKPLSAHVRNEATFAAGHASPADVSVPETMGRVNRSTAGDANNDGYNEQLGAYQLQATGGRLEATLAPRGSVVSRPVLQIAGLPRGRALITIEGRLVERSTWLDDGQLLVDFPAKITRPTLVTVRIQ